MGNKSSKPEAEPELSQEEKIKKEAKELKAALDAGGTQQYNNLVEKKLNEWKEAPLNVAVIGNSGVGKSSFINAMRGLTPEDKGAAKVGVTEVTGVQTKGIQSYPHPDNPMLLFWDLPGVGTLNFPKKTYLKDVDVARFDFFLLMTASRFTENDAWLGTEIGKRNKKYFFVRTKIDFDIQNHRKNYPTTHNDQEVFEKIRESSVGELRKLSGDDKETAKDDDAKTDKKPVPVFLIDSYVTLKPEYDFQKLKERLIEDFPELKKSALIFSLTASSEMMIRMKVTELRRRGWLCAAGSALAAVQPVPGLSIAVDITIIVAEAIFYYKQLHLDYQSLQRYEKMDPAVYNKMQAVVKETLGLKAASEISLEIMKTIVLVILRRSVLLATTTAAEEAAKAFLPLLGGILVAAPLSLGGTKIGLNLVLDKFEEVAIEVVKCAAEVTVTQE